MELFSLPKITEKPKKRLGRGIGSGRGKTSGRGQKGQKARGKIPASVVGGGLILYKKLPFKRGWGRNGGNSAQSVKPVLVPLSKLNVLKAQTVVTLSSLIENKIVSERQAFKKGVKILTVGELNVPLIIELPVSKKVREMVIKSGGSCK